MRQRRPEGRDSCFARNRRLKGVAQLAVFDRGVLALVGPIAESQDSRIVFVESQRRHVLAHRAHQHAVHVGNGGDDAIGQIVLERQQISGLDITSVSVTPELRAAVAVDQTHANTQRATGPADAAVDEIPRAKRRAELPRVGARRFLLAGRVRRHHRQVGEPRETRSDVLGQAVGQ